MKHNKEKLGEIGERIFACMVPGCNFSKDKFDRVKDLEHDGKTFEVKTQVRYQNENCFTVRAGKQIEKCENVDFLIFVEFDATDYIKVWHCESTRSHEQLITSHGVTRGYYCDKMNLISEVFWPNVAQSMRDLSESSVFNKPTAAEQEGQLSWSM